jgi:magnesium-transporting ATPase (P-type)
VNLLKINFQNLTISLQTFEWLCYWNMINFQKNYDMTTVCVEKRKFKIREKRCWRIYLTIVVLIFIGTITGLIVFIFNNPSKNEGFALKQAMAIGEASLNLAFFIVTSLLFFYEASHRQHAMFYEHIK